MLQSLPLLLALCAFLMHGWQGMEVDDIIPESSHPRLSGLSDIESAYESIIISFDKCQSFVTSAAFASVGGASAWSPWSATVALHT